MGSTRSVKNCVDYSIVSLRCRACGACRMFIRTATTIAASRLGLRSTFGKVIHYYYT